jgi:ech hydrogenase subunit D
MSEESSRSEAGRPGGEPPGSQTIEEIPLETLLERVQRMRVEGWRLAQACCTRLAADQEVDYSFDRDGRLLTLRVRLPLEAPRLASISCYYWSAFLYENEMHDLFGIEVSGMAVDYHGRLYTTMIPVPYAAEKADHAG